jgi:hypothetical protein
MKDLSVALFVWLLLLPASASAGKEGSSRPPHLPAEHRSTTGAYSLRTPAAWIVRTTPGEWETTEARGDGLIVRILRRDGEMGLDSLHAQCMLVRLAAPMEAEPQVDYEYDFLGGEVGERRALDSAFVVHYDEPIGGQRHWRQRNLTVVGKGGSLCLIGYSPLPAWRKSKATRGLLDAVLASVGF